MSAEVVATDTEGMLREGRELAAIDPHVVVKVPFTQGRREGLPHAGGRGHEVNVTLIFSATQALLAAKVGAALREPVRRPAR